MPARAFDQPATGVSPPVNAVSVQSPQQSALLRMPLVTLYLTDRCNSRRVTCAHWRHGRTDMNLESVTQLLPSLVQLWRELDSHATSFLLPGKANV